MASGNIYANTQATGFTINFFLKTPDEPRQAWLAAPFFTTPEPINALTDKGCQVFLVVRFSPATHPAALKSALENPLVKVRYYTDQKFHTKLYVIDDVALVGSANLTDSGLKSNRELSVVLRQDRDAAFQQLPTVFDELWNYADVLTADVLRAYTQAFNQKRRPETEDAFERHLKQFVEPASPPSVVVDSAKVSKERSFIQKFRRKYDEILIPFHNEIVEATKKHGLGRVEYEGQDPQIEIGRFLGWLRLVHGSGDGWREKPLLPHGQREQRIAHYVSLWQSTHDIMGTDAYEAEQEIENISNIREFLSDPDELAQLDFDAVFDYLAGCHAFVERLRFASKGLGENLSGLERLRIQFTKDNTLKKTKDTINYLLSGDGDPIERAYDCIYNSKYKLDGFGEACVMELLGWGIPGRPPFNNRTIRGMRFLGYDVEHLVAGE